MIGQFQRDRGFRMQPDELADRRGDEFPAKAIGRGDPQFSPDARRSLAQPFVQLLDRIDDRRALGGQKLTFIGQHEPARRTVDQPYAHALFKRLEPLGHRWRRHVEPTRCVRQRG